MGLSQESLGIYLGPDTDTIKTDARHDGCHFSEHGLNAAAALWISRVLYLTGGLDSRDGAFISEG